MITEGNLELQKGKISSRKNKNRGKCSILSAYEFIKSYLMVEAKTIITVDMEFSAHRGDTWDNYV